MKTFFKSIPFRKDFDISVVYIKLLITIILLFVGTIIASILHVINLDYIILPQPLADNQVFVIIGILFDGLLILMLFRLKLFSYRLNVYQYFTLFLVLTIYYFLRIEFTSTRSWDFLPIGSNIKILDLPFVVILIIFLFSLLKEFLSIKHNQENTFFEDIPLYNQDNNSLLLKNLEPILFQDYYSNAFSVAIIGKWGAGKSSFLNELIREVNRIGQNNKNIIHIQFSPFLNRGNESIIHEFFSLLRTELRFKSGQLSNKILIYGDKLSNAIKEKNPLELIRSNNISDSNSAVGELYYEIKKALEQLSLKIIVTIDDVDRLNASEINEVLKLIRNTANFPNIVFVVALDKDYVIKTLKKDDEKYLEKYFQLELHVSKISKRELIQDFLIKLNDKIINENVSYFTLDQNNQTLIKILEHNLNTHRDVIRLINQVQLDIGLCTENNSLEIDPIEIIYLSILKLFHWNVFDQLRLEKIPFLQYTDEYQTIKLGIDEDRTINELTEQDVSDYGNNVENKYSVGSDWILLGLFGTFKDSLLTDFKLTISTASVKRINRLKFYFERTLPSDEMSNEEFHKLINLPDKELKDSVFLYCNKENYSKLIQLYLKLNELDNSEIDLVKKTLLIHFLILSKTEDIWLSQLNGIENICLILIERDKQEFSRFLRKLLDERTVKDSLIGNFILRTDPSKWGDKYQFDDDKWLHLIWKFKDEKDILECFKMIKQLISYRPLKNSITPLRDLFFAKIQSNNYSVLEENILSRADRLNYTISKEDTEVFGNLNTMLREMDRMNQSSNGLLIELIRLNILREKENDFRFRFSFKKFSKKETYKEIQLIYGINNLDLFDRLDHEDFIAFCNENNIRFEKHIFSENIGPIILFELHHPQPDTVEKLLDQLVMYYKQMPNRPSNISSIVDHYNIRSYVSNNDDIINTYSFQGFK